MAFLAGMTLPAPSAAAVCLLAAGILAGCMGSDTGGDVLRVGLFPNLTHAAALVGSQKGLFEQHLGPGKVKFYELNAGPAAMEALFAGQLDVTYVGPGPTLNAYVRSKGEALHVIAGATAGGASLVVQGKLNITKPSDFEGRRIASPQVGNTQDIALRHYLQVQGLTTKEQGGTVELVETPNPDILTLFKKGDLDAAWVPEPWATRLLHEAGGKLFLDERTLWANGTFETTEVVASSAILKAHPERVRAFLDAHIEATQFLQAQPEEARAALQTELTTRTGKTLPDEQAQEALARLNVSWDPAAPSVRTYAQWSYDLGLLGASPPDLRGMWDLRLLNEALAAKGLPQVSA